MKLEMDCVAEVPSLSLILKSTPWRRIRWRAEVESNFKCSICSAQDELVCHEIWEIDDIKHVATLKGVTSLCRECHEIKHGAILRRYLINIEGLTSTQLYQAKKVNRRIQLLERHFMKVNKVGRNTMEEEKEKVRKIRQVRFRYELTIDNTITGELIAKGMSGGEYCRAIERYMRFIPKLANDFMKCSKCGIDKGTTPVCYRKRLLESIRKGINEEEMHQSYICLECRTKKAQTQAYKIINSF